MSRVPRSASAEALVRVRAICLALPGVVERLSHEAPVFFVGEKKASFVAFADNIHSDGRIALWCAAPLGAQQRVIDADPENYFVPPYVGGRGWIGMRLDRGLAWKSIKGGIKSAWEMQVKLKPKPKPKKAKR